MIYILEDNQDRVRQFKAAAALAAPRTPVRIWHSARQMITDLADGLEHATIISLDHDLDPLATAVEDPGCGYDVAKLLGELIPCYPVIVHTSNKDGGSSMIEELSRGGWRVERVFPMGDDWITHDWLYVLRKFLHEQE